MKIVFDQQAWEDYLYWQATDPKQVARISQLIRDAMRSPFSGIGKPEPQRGPLAGWWSRCIDGEHRLVYRPGEDPRLVANAAITTASDWVRHRSNWHRHCYVSARDNNHPGADMTVSGVFPTISQPSGATQTRQNVQGSSTFGDLLQGLSANSSDTSGSDAVSTFTDLMKGTPEQRMFKLFLARHHLTEDQYKALSTDDQKKLADEFKQELKKKTQATTEGSASLDIQV